MITDFETWLLDVGMNRTFSMLEYRRPGDWTPLEASKKYIDQTHYRSDSYKLIRIKEAIKLPDGDILVGYIDVTDDFEDFDESKAWIDYRKLSEIELAWNPEDDEPYDVSNEE